MLLSYLICMCKTYSNIWKLKVIGNYYTGCFVYADDITLAPSCDSLNNMLKSCELWYAQNYDIVFNPSKTRCMHFARENTVSGSVSIMKNDFGFNCTLSGVKIVDDFSTDIDHSAVQFNIKCRQILLHFKNLTCDVLSKMISINCIDACSFPLCNFECSLSEKYYVAWRKVMRRVWRVSTMTYCKLLPIMPIYWNNDGKKVLKFIWNCCKIIQKCVNLLNTNMSLNNRKSVLK